jgi:LGFP repeat
MDQALKDLWRAVRPRLAYSEDLGIYRFWAGIGYDPHWKDLGSPIGPERRVADDVVYQAFANGIVRWHPTEGPSVV